MPCSHNLEESSREVKTLEKIDGWHNLTAVRNGKVYAVEASSFFSRSGPRLVDGLEILAEILHEDIFHGLAPKDSYLNVA
jgi:iron complex transport system substrate-binding protein